MATGIGACVYLRNIKQPSLFIRNEALSATMGQGLGQLRLRQFPRKIHTVCQITVPPRSFLGLRPAGALISGNRSALEEYRLTNGASYLTNHRSLRGLSNTSRLLSQPLAKEQLWSNEHTLEHASSLSSVTSEIEKIKPSEIEKIETEKATILLDQMRHEFDDLTAFARCNILRTVGRSSIKQLSDSRFKTVEERWIVGTTRKAKKRFKAEIEASSPLMAKILARKSIIEQLQKAGYWARLQELRRLSEAGDKKYSRAAEAFIRSLNRNEKHLEIAIQDDLLMTFDKDAREGLKQANLSMRAEEVSRKRGYDLPPHKSFSCSTNPESVKKRNIALLRSKQRAETSTDPEYRALRKRMMALPVRSYEKQVLDLIERNTYSILVAQTGSGKSTQLPQLILENAIANDGGAGCRVLCVQPRQLAATSLASRVARERCEKLGNSVGYSVRFNNCPPADGGSIKYCTTGILFNILRGGPANLEQFSHIVLDEVHVRDTQIDMVMMLLKRAIEKRQSIGATVPKIISMSATIDVDRFASYFGTKAPDGTVLPAPHLTIPGRTFEVKRHYLEEVAHNIAHSLPPEILSVLLRCDQDTAFFLNNHFKSFDNSDKDKIPSPSEAKILELGEVNVPSGLVSATLLSLLSTTKEGSILAFVPGKQQIQEIILQMKEIGPRLGFDFEDADRFKIIRLHAEFTNEQRELSVPVPQSCRRIIISTDIAETSLTIPDVRFVIDSGKVNQMNFDTEEQLGQLAPRWISKSAALQRAGRAGRTQAGDYYFLGSSKQFDTLRITKSPEITRANLEELCLHAKRAALGTSDSISDLLRQTIEPPSDARIRAALESLKHLQALDDQEELTGLGHILERLDMDPSFGKMVVLGVIFRCLDPMVILASLGPHANLFERYADDIYHNKLMMESRSDFQQGLKSDHMIDINAYRAVRDQDSGLPAAEFARSRYIDFDVFKKSTAAGRQIIAKLRGTKLIPRFRSKRNIFGGKHVNINSDNPHLIKALLVHCLAPNLAVKRAGTSALEIKPGVSVAQRMADHKEETAILAYSRKWATKQIPLGISELTQVRPLAACLLANKLEVEGDKIVLDSWMQFQIKSEGFSREEVSDNLVQQHKLLNDALHAAFEALPTKEFDDDEEKQRYLEARQVLFTNLENTMELIVNMDAPPLAPNGPKHWE